METFSFQQKTRKRILRNVTVLYDIKPMLIENGVFQKKLTSTQRSYMMTLVMF